MKFFIVTLSLWSKPLRWRVSLVWRFGRKVGQFVREHTWVCVARQLRSISWNHKNRSIGTSRSIHSYYEFWQKMFLAHDSPIVDFQTFPRNHSHPFCATFWV